MKKNLLYCLVFCISVNGCAEPQAADNILAFVRTRLPDDPLKLSGSLKVKTRNGFTKSNLPITMELHWGAATPTATYIIDKASLTITWEGDRPSYAFSDTRNKPTDDILGTGLTWADLSFSVLWWPNARLIDETAKINRDCYVVDVPVPDTDMTMRLWIEKKMGMLLESQTLDTRKKPLRRMKIKSIKKMDGLWVAKDLEIKDYKTGSKTTLQVTALEWQGAEEGPEGPGGPAEKTFDAAESINDFACHLYNAFAKKEGNLFFSP